MKPGRVSAAEVIVFDSTEMAPQDVFTATMIYEQVVETGVGTTMRFA